MVIVPCKTNCSADMWTRWLAKKKERKSHRVIPNNKSVHAIRGAKWNSTARCYWHTHREMFEGKTYGCLSFSFTQFAKKNKSETAKCVREKRMAAQWGNSPIGADEKKQTERMKTKNKKIVSSRTHQVANDDEVPSAPCRTRRLKVNKQKSETHKQDANEKNS